MKEEMLKLLKSINLELNKEDEDYEHYKSIKEEFEYAINEVEKTSEHNMIFNELDSIKEQVEKINTATSDFKKFKYINKLQRNLIALV